MDKVLLKEIESILRNEKLTGSYPQSDKKKHCFISAYQLAILLHKSKKKEVKNALKNLKYPQEIGGKGLGKRKSLSQRIANELSSGIKRKEILKIEMAFLCTNELEQISFRDEMKILREPSDNCFSMFKYKDED